MGRKKHQPKKGGLVQKLPKEWIPYFQQHGMTPKIKECTQDKEVDNHANCFSGQDIS